MENHGAEAVMIVVGLIGRRRWRQGIFAGSLYRPATPLRGRL